LPGTHSKWAIVERGRIARFATFMTGELYDLLISHSILGRLIEGDGHDAAAFRRGVECKTEQGGLLKHLFGARSLPLLDRLPRSGVSSYLSGLLIGSEIDGALTWLRATGQPNGETVVLGSEALAELYVEALRIKAIEAVVGVKDAAVGGLLRIARLKDLF
jgi:2-dehydro-3-deoxygalactonokinase